MRGHPAGVPWGGQGALTVAFAELQRGEAQVDLDDAPERAVARVDNVADIKWARHEQLEGGEEILRGLPGGQGEEGMGDRIPGRGGWGWWCGRATHQARSCARGARCSVGVRSGKCAA
eukprot:1232246-Prymnesium_polylepis.1